MPFTKRELIYSAIWMLWLVWVAWGTSLGVIKLIEGFKNISQPALFEGLLFFAVTYGSYKVMKWASPVKNEK